MSPGIGLLALQGDFAAHGEALRRAGASAREVRRPEQLDSLAGLVIPGGESTTLLNLMRDAPWFDEIGRFAARGGALLGTCAGAILLARRVEPEQPCLGLLDAVVRRNGYGRQIDSFETDLAVEGRAEPLRGVFIRAPRFIEVGPAVRVLARCGDEPVLVRQGRILAGTFHPELTEDVWLHRQFVTLVREGRTDLPASADEPAEPRSAVL